MFYLMILIFNEENNELKYRKRFVGNFHKKFELERFPFDHQCLPILLQTDEHHKFDKVENGILHDKLFELSDWELLS
jgi:hypothetical protein